MLFSYPLNEWICCAVVSAHFISVGLPVCHFLALVLLHDSDDYFLVTDYCVAWGALDFGLFLLNEPNALSDLGLKIGAVYVKTRV